MRAHGLRGIRTALSRPSLGLPHLHGWVYDIRTGLLRTLVETGAERPPHEIYTYDFPNS